ncbi:MAG: MFS transporter [Rhodobacteraceae bacterium]|jgi:MFS family permease|nr:MFS transporter [Paracoccaceae bacterium]
MSLLSALRLSRQPALAFAAMGACWGAFAAFVPDIKAGLGASDALFGALLLGSSVGLLSAMWLAPIVDSRLGRYALPAASAALATAFLLPGLASVPAAFAAAMLMVGMTSGLTDVVMNARVSELETAHRRTLMNLNHAMFSFAYAASAFATGFAREAGLPPVAVFGVIAVGVYALVPFMPIATRTAAGEEVPRAFPVSLVVWGGGIVLLAFLFENAMEGWSALHIERTLGGGAAEGAFGPAILGLTMGIGRLSGQILAERVREAPVILAASALAAFGMLTAALAPTPLVAYLGFGLAGLGVSVIAPMALALIGRHARDSERTRAISRAAVIGFLGFFIGPPMIGFVSEATSLRLALGFVALLLALVPLMLAMLLRDRAVRMA